MVKFAYRSKYGEDKDISPEQVAKLLGAVVKTEIVVQNGLPSSTKRLILFLSGTVAILLLSIGVYGWDYQTSKEFTNDGMVTVRHFVKVMSLELPHYKMEKVSRTDYIRENFGNSDLNSTLAEGQFYGVRDGKVIVNRYRRDTQDQQSAKVD